MFVSSTDSKNKFINNSFDDFVVELNPEIELECNCYRTEWTFALTEISISNGVQSLLPEACIVLCDLAQCSYIKDGQAPVLRTIASESDKTGSLYQSYYIGINKLRFNRLRIYLRNKDLDPLNKELWDPNIILKITLHFQRI